MRWLLVAAIVFQVAMALAWMRVDRLPPYWDEAAYLYNGAAQLDALRSGGASAWYETWTTLDRTRPLLVSTLTMPFYALFGVSADAGLLVNIVALIALSLSVYALGAAMGGRRAGIMAALLVGGYPVLIGLSHILLSELTMVALAAATLLALWKSDGFARVGWSLLAGALTGLGMLTKVFFAPFVAGPWLVSLWVACRPRGAGRASVAGSLGRAALALLAALALALPWYTPNLKTVVERSLSAATGAEAAAYGPATPLVLYALTRYLGMFLNEGTAFAGLLALAAGIVGLALPRPQASDPASGKGRAVVFLLSSILPAYALFTSLTNQDLKHVTGVLPALAVLSGWGIARLAGRRWGWALGAAGLVMLAQVTLGTFPGKLQNWKPWLIEVRGFSLQWTYPAQPWAGNTRYAAPARDEWPIHELLAYALQVTDLKTLSRSRARVATVTEFAGSDHAALLWEIRRREMPMDIAWLEVGNLWQPDVVFYRPDHGPEIASRADTAGAIVAAMEQPQSGFHRMPRTFIMPDGGEVFVYARRDSPLLAEAPRPAFPADATFGGAARLLGVDRAMPDQETLDLTFYWQSLAPTQGDYKVFVHLLDPDTGEIVAQDDRPLFPLIYPTSQWQPDRWLRDQSVIRLNKAYNKDEIVLRVGLYSEAGRLPITAGDAAQMARADHADLSLPIR